MPAPPLYMEARRSLYTNMVELMDGVKNVPENELQSVKTST